MLAGEPNGWVYDIDRHYPDDQPVPPEAIRGAWKIDDAGEVTEAYEKNARYRPVEISARPLKPYMYAAARTNRAQWIVEINPRGETFFPDIPPKCVKGWWYVDAEGLINGEFRPNSQWDEN